LARLVNATYQLLTGIDVVVGAVFPQVRLAPRHKVDLGCNEELSGFHDIPTFHYYGAWRILVQGPPVKNSRLTAWRDTSSN